jgi:uncharacterized protein
LIYNRLGKTELEVSKLGFGLMRLPLVKNNPDFRFSTELIQGAIHRGINFFDVGTFYCHGHCEEAFGKALRGGIKDKIYYCGKNTSHQEGNPHWDVQLRNTLKLFSIKRLDICFLHYIDYKTWEDYFIRNGGVKQIQKAKEKGMFKYLGFSSHDTPENIKLLIDTDLFDAVILQYNLLETRNEQIIKYASRKGLGVIIMNPLAGGILANPENFSGMTDDMAVIRKAAFKFIFNNPDIHCTLSGMNSIKEVEENIRILENTTLRDYDITYVQNFINGIIKTNQVLCTQCNYCMPCPQGIHIPEIVNIYNKYCFLSNQKLFSREYSLLQINAGCCIECGICEVKCPNEIQVMRIMKESAEKYFD